MDILLRMTKRLVDIDDDKLATARELLDTPTIKATVDRALDELIGLRRRLALLEDLRDPSVFDFGDDPDEFRASGWR
jgi:Arc/MetJ family transcription regulator